MDMEDLTIQNAMAILHGRLKKPEAYFTCPDDTQKYCVLRLATREHESFCVMYLDNRHGLIKFDELFTGTIDGASVHPRVVAKAALQANAAAVILIHNHPSGNPEPSQADIKLTRRLVDALTLIEIRVLDHLVVGHTEAVSFAERGLI